MYICNDRGSRTGTELVIQSFHKHDTTELNLQQMHDQYMYISYIPETLKVKCIHKNVNQSNYYIFIDDNRYTTSSGLD